jgi:murein DD-endopeptidase MepM/ murein hydrolase activator NlpD
MTPDAIASRIFGRTVRISRGYSSSHDGIDYAAAGGTAVRAAAGGRVAYARNALFDPKARSSWAEGGGNVVEVDHGGGIWTQYAHLRSIAPGIAKGGQITAGTIIGYVGQTGNATGNHLHFGVWDHNKGHMVNPSTWNGAGGSTAAGPLGPQGPSSSTPLPFINIPEGKILTIADVDGVILAAFDKAGTFGDPVSGGIARDVARAKLMTFIGQPWNKATRDAMQALLFQAATEAGAVGTAFDLGLQAIGGAIGDATFTLVVLGGIVALFLIGAYVTVRPSSPAVIIKRAIA